MKVWNEYIKCWMGAVTVCVLLLTAFYCPAQLLSNKGQEIFIGTNALVTIQGSVQNTGTLTNNGEIVLTGDWENDGAYRANNGALVFAGKDQNIDHNGADIYELVIEGGGEKVFVSDATVSGKLYLTDGIITPEKDVKLLAKASSAIHGGNTKAYINGAFYQEGGGTKRFPIGKNGHYSPVELQLYGNPVVGFEVFEPNPATHFSLELRMVSRLKYWQQHLISGQIEEGSSITLPMFIEEGGTDPEAMVIAGTSLQDGTYKLLETLDYSGTVNNGIITGLLTPSFEIFALGLLAESPEERALYIPNAFAPFSQTASLEDARVKVYGKEISHEDFLFRVYNRWGVLVYETLSYDEAKTEGWDGTNKDTGRPEMMGSYKYIMKGKFNSGKPIEKTGSIHLIR